MNGTVAANRARWTLGIIFTTFLVVNVVVLTLSLLAHLRGNPNLMPLHLGDEVPMGLRFFWGVGGLILTWVLARTLYKRLVKEEVPPSDAVWPSVSLLSYLLLVVWTLVFLGAGPWLPILFLGFFLIVFLSSLISLWSLVGWIPMVVALLLALLSGALTVYFSP